MQSVTEGIMIVNNCMEITFINEVAKEILQLENQEMESSLKKEIPHLQKVLERKQEEVIPDVQINGMEVSLHCIPIMIDHEIVYGMVIFRDKTEQKKRQEELADIELYTDTLRTQTHEFMNKLHVISGLAYMGAYDKLHEYIQEIVKQYEVGADFIIQKIKNPIFAGFLLGKHNKAREEGVEFIVNEDSYLPDWKDSHIIHQLIEIVGNLINNGMDAMENCTLKKMDFYIGYEGGNIFLKVQDTGKGMSEDVKERIFKKGFSTRGENRGLGLYLLSQNVKKLNGSIQVDTIIGKGTLFQITLPYKESGNND